MPEFIKRIALLMVPFIIIAALSIHVYVAYPHYTSKLPYFSQAILVGLKFRCQGPSTESLNDVLSRVSLPFFSLNNRILYRDANGAVSECSSALDSSGPAYETFRFASVTKTITAFSVIELADERSDISLDTKLLEFFPEIDSSALTDTRLKDVDLYSLMSHSSGFGGLFGSDNMVSKDEKSWCPHDLSRLESVRLAGQPGTNSVYSNVAYCLLGEVISRKAGKPYTEHIEEEYFTGYPSLRFISEEFLPTEPAYDYSNDWRFDQSYADWLDLRALAPAAGIAGKPEEMVSLIQRLYFDHPEILWFPSVPGCKDKKQGRCYSANLVIHDLPENKRVGVQQGYLPGASSLLAIHSDGHVLLVTSAGAPLEPHHREWLEEKALDVFR